MSRNRNSLQRPDRLAASDRLTLSNDGYIRISLPQFQAIPLFHLLSGLEKSYPANILGGAIETEISGYTEWISNTKPAITIGWDWVMGALHHVIVLRRISAPRCNVMLQDLSKRDLGPVDTVEHLEIFIDKLDWQATVQKHIAIRYAHDGN